MKNFYILICIVLTKCVCVCGQSTEMITIKFHPLGIQPSTSWDIDEIHLQDSTDVIIDLLRFYTSHVQLVHDGQVVFTELNSFHLVDGEDSLSQEIYLQVPDQLQFDSLRFMIGVDSTTSRSGALGGDLDPTKGMFWTWNTGYIFFKIEGRSMLSDARKNRVTYHIGGYEGPNAAMRWITLPVENRSHIDIDIDVAHFLSKIDIRQYNGVMSPSSYSHRCADYFKESFKIKKHE